MGAVAQPAGTVTLVFTDIEGSTRLLDELGEERYREALAEHRAAVRDAFGRWEGYEVDYEGDSFFYSFGSARSAIRAVAEAMARLDGGPIRIRVGVHTGEPALDPPKYVGLAVHKAARIMAAGHGGQVLMSESTRDLVGEEFVLRDLGRHRLKDIAAIERLWQLGDGRHPPLRTLYRSNLPVPVTALIGRTAELAELVELVQSGADVVTLSGPGGTGKTRLALEVGAAVRDGFPDGVWWISLAALSDPQLLLASVARVLELPEEPGLDLRDVLRDVLAGRRMLLVLDNLEHLLPGAAREIAALRAADGPVVLVTSRQRLNLSGEIVRSLPELELHDAVALFVERAGAVSRTIEVDRTVEELCTRLDRLPLAIELAAARTVALSPLQILERLGARLDLLEGTQDAEPRQQSLRAAIEWSYELLDPAEQSLFAGLAVFAGGCTLDAAEAVCGADPKRLQSLVDKSLLRFDGRRFWMLETVAEFAAERLAVDENEARRRHLHFFEGFALAAEAGLRSSEIAVWFDRVADELPNVRAAMRCALATNSPDEAVRIASALFRYWEGRGAATEGRAATAAAIAAGGGSGSEEAWAHYCLGSLAHFQGDLQSALLDYERAAVAGRRVRSEGIAACALAREAMARVEQGDLDQAVRLADEALELARDVEDELLRAEALMTIGAVSRNQSLLTEALELVRRLGDVSRLVDVLNILGTTSLTAGNHAAARSSFEDSLDLARRLGDSFQITLAAGNLGELDVVEGRYEEALVLLVEALDLCRARGDRRSGSGVIVDLAAAYAGLGEHDLALRLASIGNYLRAELGLVATQAHTAQLVALIDRARACAGEQPPSAGAATLDAAVEELERAHERTGEPVPDRHHVTDD